MPFRLLLFLATRAFGAMSKRSVYVKITVDYTTACRFRMSLFLKSKEKQTMCIHLTIQRYVIEANGSICLLVYLKLHFIFFVSFAISFHFCLWRVQTVWKWILFVFFSRYLENCCSRALFQPYFSGFDKCSSNFGYPNALRLSWLQAKAIKANFMPIKFPFRHPFTLTEVCAD